MTAEYGMLPASTGSRTPREASAGKQKGRTGAFPDAALPGGDPRGAARGAQSDRPTEIISPRLESMTVTRECGPLLM